MYEMAKRKKKKLEYDDYQEEDDPSLRTKVYKTFFNKARADLLRVSLIYGKMRPKEMRKYLMKLGHSVSPQQLDRDLNTFLRLGLFNYNVLRKEMEERYVPNTQRIQLVVNALDVIENHFYANKVFDRIQAHFDNKLKQEKEFDLQRNLQTLLQPPLWSHLTLDRQREVMKWITHYHMEDSTQKSLDEFSIK